MNLEEIKKWREGKTFSSFDKECIDRLISETEKWQQDFHDHCDIQVDCFYKLGMKEAAKRCAEIAGQTSKLAEHRIKLEFNL